MAQQFCTSCGARVESADQRFCVKCGAALVGAEFEDAAAQPHEQDARPADYDLSGFGQMNHPEESYTPYSYAPADGEVDPSSPFSREAWRSSGTTQPIGADGQMPGQAGGWQQAGTQPYPQPAPQPAGGSGASRIVIIVSAVIVVLVAVGFIVTNLGSCGSTSAPQPTESTAVVDGDSSSSADDGDGEDADDETIDEDDGEDADDDDARDDEIYGALSDAYDTMGDQANRIKDVAGVLNNTIFASDRAKREAAARDAYDLQGQVADLLDELNGLDVASSSRYHTDWQTLIELQEDLQKRIDVMCEAWDISLQYSKPKDHEAAITKPLGKDNDSKGVNIYKKDFEDRYPNARPQR